MLQLLDEPLALKISSKYFSYLEQTGYMKHRTVMRFLAYQFLLDLVEYTHFFYEEEDYEKVGAALSSLFTNGGCLLPFPVFCANRATLGRNEYMGVMKVRKTEDLSGYEDRSTEDDYYRTV